MNQQRASSFFKFALDYCNKEHREDIERAKALSPTTLDGMTCTDFLALYCWVVYATGFKVKTVANKFPELSKAYQNFEIERLCRMESLEPALKVINHEAKAKCFQKGAQMILAQGFDRFREEIKQNWKATLLRLPYIGSTNVNHL
jgi:3-methyladenine DNA glycosylase Tag